jgi:predicted metal-dependent hydrolase
MDQVPEYTLTRKRIKNLRLTVKAPDGDVVVSAPRHVPDAAIAAFVKDKAAWIQKHRDRLANQPRPLEAGPEAEAMRAQLKETVPPLVEYWADRMGLPMPTLAFRRMTTRWGSCNTQTKRITFNLELGRRDPELLEYVVVHELAHLIERGHNARFYEVMDEYLPEWRILRRVLNGSSSPAP